MELDISTTREGNTCVIKVAGEIDVYTSPSLKSALVAAVSEGCRILIVDLDKVGFIDSSGLGVLVGALRRARETDGDLRIVSARETVVKIFRITGLDRVFPVYPTLDEAREA
jgi:anti-sigma B factor antagonist